MAMPNSFSQHVDDETIVDVKLFKTIGLYHLMCPTESVKSFGNGCRTILQVTFVAIVILYTVQTCVLYLAVDDFPRFTYMILLITVSLMCSFKAYVLLRYSDLMWSVLDLAGFAFTFSGREDPSELIRCRKTLSTVLRTFVVINVCTLISWLLSPILIHEPVSVINLDGSEAMYRTSIYNIWTPLSEDMYNSFLGYATMYTIESICCSSTVFIWTLFDCYVMTVCYVLNANFRTMAIGYQTLGQSAVRNAHHGQKIHSKADYFDDLMIRLKDNQKIIEKYNEYFDVIQPVVLVQIATGSVSAILLIFFTSLMYVTDGTLLSMPVFKFFSGFLIVAMQLFFYCYAFTYVDTAKSTVNFGLYCSNWTEMDLKFQKTLLLAMGMNSIHKRIMKLSPLSIINLEMFAGVMNTAYSVVPLLLNSSVEQPVEE